MFLSLSWTWGNISLRPIAEYICSFFLCSSKKRKILWKCILWKKQWWIKTSYYVQSQQHLVLCHTPSYLSLHSSNGSKRKMCKSTRRGSLFKVLSTMHWCRWWTDHSQVHQLFLGASQLWEMNLAPGGILQDSIHSQQQFFSCWSTIGHPVWYSHAWLGRERSSLYTG